MHRPPVLPSNGPPDEKVAAHVLVPGEGGFQMLSTIGPKPGRLRTWAAACCLLAGLILVLAGCTPRDLPEPLRDLPDLLDNPAVRVPLILAGLALLLAGYWLVKFMIALPGFIIGALVGAAIGTALQGGEFGFLSIVGGLLVGGIGAGLALLLFYVGIFLSGFGLGLFIGSALGAGVLHNNDVARVLGIILGIILGIVAVVLWKFVQIVLTAGMGTALLGTALGWMDKPFLLLLIWLVGIAVQYGLFKVVGPRPEDRPAAPAAAPAQPAAVPQEQPPPPGPEVPPPSP